MGSNLVKKKSKDTETEKIEKTIFTWEQEIKKLEMPGAIVFSIDLDQNGVVMFHNIKIKEPPIPLTSAIAVIQKSINRFNKIYFDSGNFKGY